MSTAEQIYQAILVLPVQERLKLVERVVHDLAERAREPEPPGGGAAGPGDASQGTVAPAAGLLIGAWAQDAELVDAVTEEILQRREQHSRRVVGDDEDP
ncbi:hypothetical protein [Chondromyces apiculatus]|uniref:Uncharacterized protein n=1 Tax=Chondromyces apiculatus DSM 436 TaxID=1192034 RepID=A0A017TG23_9BACT|nr:hypothetical protein [Chondromyces apiculatus]EYF07775.1 Hypothetical protein CAP_6797 [Chondromyces apiculatus DSM 436]